MTRPIKCVVFSLTLLAASALNAATGDILSVSIATNGWQALVTIDGVTTNGTYSLGLGTNNTLVAPTVVLQVTSLGFDDVGQPTTNSRLVYGTRPVRLPYPNQIYNDESLAGSSVTVKIALSDFIYPGDTATATILAGLYKQSASAAQPPA